MRHFRIIRRILNKVRAKAERLGYGFRLWVSTRYARQELSIERPLKILVDNTVLAAGRVFSTAWFSTGTQRWGQYHEFDSGYLAPYPTHSPETHGRVYDHVSYLPGIIYLAERGYIELLTSFEMQQEQMHQPAGRYRVRGYFDHNLFGAIRMRSVDEDTVKGFDLWEKPQDRLRRCPKQPFLSIVQLFGERNNVDAWHLFTLLTYDIDLMLHIDHPLADFVKQHQSKPPISQLMGRVIMPMELAHRLRIEPIQISSIPQDWL